MGEKFHWTDRTPDPAEEHSDDDHGRPPKSPDQQGREIGIHDDILHLFAEGCRRSRAKADGNQQQEKGEGDYLQRIWEERAFDDLFYFTASDQIKL